MSFHGLITHEQHDAAECHCQLHAPPYCLLIWWVPGHPFHRQPCTRCSWR